MTKIIEAHPEAPSYSRDVLVTALAGVEERQPSSKGKRLGPRVRLPGRNSHRWST